MQAYFESFGISVELFNYIIMPLLIFFARVSDVSINTLRIMFMLNGKKKIAPILGFFEASIIQCPTWLMRVVLPWVHL